MAQIDTLQKFNKIGVILMSNQLFKIQLVQTILDGKIVLHKDFAKQ